MSLVDDLVQDVAIWWETRRLPEQDIRLSGPRHRMKKARVVSRWGRHAIEVQDCLVYGAVTTDLTTSTITEAKPVEHLWLTHLPQPLPTLLVTNDPTAPASTAVDAAQVQVGSIPVDRDRYDGRAWRVFSADAAFAHAVLTEELWGELETLGRQRRFCVWIDGDRVVTVKRPGAHHALLLLTQRLTARLNSGELTAWVTAPEAAPTARDVLRTFRGTGWRTSAVDPAIAAEIGVSMFQYNLMVHGRVDAGEFKALRQPQSRSKVVDAHLLPVDWEVSQPARGLVLVRLDHRIDDKVVFLHRPWHNRDDVEVEWLDFDDEFSIRARNERIGHNVATPLLMQYLYDNRVRQLTVQGHWLIASVADFTPSNLRAVARVLLAARPLLPKRSLTE